jgi:hypothetical protein
LSIKSPLFMDGTMNFSPLSTKSPVSMDRKQIFHGLSPKCLFLWIIGLWVWWHLPEVRHFIVRVKCCMY